MRGNSSKAVSRLRNFCARAFGAAAARALLGVCIGVALAAVSHTSASAACTVPNTLTNGQTADATQVMGNLNALGGCAVNTTGSPTTGAIAGFSGPTAVTNATSSANTVLANPTNATAPVQALAMPNCTDTNGQHLNYTTGTGFSCGASGGGGSGSNAGALSLIQSQTISSATPFVTFNSIPSGYTDLVLVTTARGDVAATSVSLRVQLNGDTGANYDVSLLAGVNNIAASQQLPGLSNAKVIDMPGASAPAGAVSATTTEIIGYANTSIQKHFYSTGGSRFGTTSGALETVVYAGDWRSTAAVTSLKLFPDTGNFVAGTTLTLYGRGGNVTVNPQPGLPVIQEVVTSGSQSTVTISSIPQTYRDLLIVVTGRSLEAVTDSVVTLRLNGDSGANYSRVRAGTINGTGTTAANASGDTGFTTALFLPGASAAANKAGTLRVSVGNYAGSIFNKQVLAENGYPQTMASIYAGQWNNTTAVTSLTVSVPTGFVDGTVITVYGIGGSPTATLPVVPPQGRLTLTSNTPVMTADATAQSTIYYAPYVGTLLPVGNVMYRVGQLSYALNTTAHVAGMLYDIGAFNNSGAITLCTAPAWGSSTVRAAPIQRDATNGIWTNPASLTCNLSGGSTTVTVASGQWTYLGTFYATANGQTGMAFLPTPMAGGTNNCLCLSNAYNRVNLLSAERDSTSTWGYVANAWRLMNNNAANRISWVDGLGQSTVDASFEMDVAGSGFNYTAVILKDAASIAGGGGNCGAAIPNCQVLSASASTWHMSIKNVDGQPAPGFHYLQMMEGNNGGGSFAMNFNSTYKLRVIMQNSLFIVPSFRRRRRRATSDNQHVRHKV